MKNLLEYYDMADLSNMSKKAGVRGSKAGFIRNLTMGRCSHHCYIVTLLHCYIVTCYIKDFTSTSRSSAPS